jgi:hypothetical protein
MFSGPRRCGGFGILRASGYVHLKRGGILLSLRWIELMISIGGRLDRRLYGTWYMHCYVIDRVRKKRLKTTMRHQSTMMRYAGT